MFKKKHKKAMAEIMAAGKFSYNEDTIVTDFLEFLGDLYDDSFNYFVKLSLSPNPQAIMVAMRDYSATYPLERMTNGRVDYTDFISRYL